MAHSTLSVQWQATFVDSAHDLLHIHFSFWRQMGSVVSIWPIRELPAVFSKVFSIFLTTSLSLFLFLEGASVSVSISKSSWYILLFKSRANSEYQKFPSGQCHWRRSSHPLKMVARMKGKTCKSDTKGPLLLNMTFTRSSSDDSTAPARSKRRVWIRCLWWFNAISTVWDPIINGVGPIWRLSPWLSRWKITWLLSIILSVFSAFDRSCVSFRMYLSVSFTICWRTSTGYPEYCSRLMWLDRWSATSSRSTEARDAYPRICRSPRDPLVV